MTKSLEDLTFEEALQELSTIVQQLEEGELELEKTVALYQRGQALAARCQTLLDEVELRVQQLQPDGAGGTATERFAGDP
jgi:exodeoxyribonuclease VII small subunit